MTKMIRIEFTVAEAKALNAAADNGYDHGSFFVESNGRDTGYGGKRANAAYLRADKKLVDAIRRAGGFKSAAEGVS